MQDAWRAATWCVALIAAIMSLASVGCKSQYEQHYDAAKALKEKGQWDKAIREYLLAAQADSSKARPYYRAAQLCKKMNRHTSATQLLFTAIDIDPYYESLYPDLVKALIRAGQPDRAKAEGLKALELEVVKSDVTLVEEIRDLIDQIDHIQRETPQPQIGATASAPPTDAGVTPPPEAGGQ